VDEIGNVTFTYLDTPGVDQDILALCVELWCTVIEEE
jgi:hypothetical protein